MSENIWNDLLDANRPTPSENETTIIISAQTSSVLKTCMKLIFGISLNDVTLDTVSYTCKVVPNMTKNGDPITLHIYTVALPLSEPILDSLRIFFDGNSTAYKWVFLLDWVHSDKKTWIKDLYTSFTILEDNNMHWVTEGSCSVICGNAEHIQYLERVSPHWNSYKIEFVTQTLRSFCLLKACGLFSLSEGMNDQFALEILRILLAEERIRPSEFIELESLFIPYRSDSVGKIKTLNEEFPVNEVLSQLFIKEKYENIVPGEVTKSQDDEDTSSPSISHDLKFEVDVQKELAALYEKQKVSMRSETNFHKPLPEDYNNIFTSYED